MFVWTEAEGTVLPIALIMTLFISILIAYLLRKKSELIRRIPLMIITAITLTLELVKQILYIMSGYDLWAIPLHFCSLFLYFYPLASFFKGKVGEFGKTMCFIAGSFFLLMFYINPRSIVGSSCEDIFKTFNTFHTFTYHHLIFLFYFTMLFSKLYKPSKDDFLYAFIGIGAYVLVAIPLAHILNTNFCNLLTSNIPFMETFRQNYGQVVYTIAMILFGIGGGEVIVLIPNLIFKKVKKEDNFNKIIKILRTEV